MTNNNKVLAKIKLAKLQKNLDKKMSLINEMEVLNAKAKGLMSAVEPILKKITNKQLKMEELKRTEAQLLRELENLGLDMSDCPIDYSN